MQSIDETNFDYDMRIKNLSLNIYLNVLYVSI